MLGYMMSNALQTFTGENGGAGTLLYYGTKKTNRMSASLDFADLKASDKYNFTLAHAAGDTLIFTEENLFCQIQNRAKPFKLTLDPGLKESGLLDAIREPNATISRVIYSLLKNIHVFQFHDTSKESRIRNNVYINDNIFLRSDAGNLAAILYAMKNNVEQEKYYERIVRYIKQVMPQFGDFVLEPLTLNKNSIMLNWKEEKSDYLFGPHQISDGSLRFMALTTLLLQPPQNLPSVIVLDEPELGLHPAAISSLSGMVKAASKHSQVIMATQSPRIVDEFDLSELLIIERDNKSNSTVVKSLDKEEFKLWIEEYSNSELWEKNVLGGKP
jgi:predicted ATPase